MQVGGGAPAFDAVNTLRLLGRWMRMFTIPNQSSVAKAYGELSPDGTRKDSPDRDRLVDEVEELLQLTLLLRDDTAYPTDRFGVRPERDEKAARDTQNPALRIGKEGL